MQPQTRYAEIKASHPAYRFLVTALVVLAALGIAAAHNMDTQGHQITGMNNQIVWGLPHVFALFLIVSASGALNLASLSSVFGHEIYKPLSRLSAVLAIALLSGGLSILLLDLGRPDRLIVAMTYYNFKSIFAWNIILYMGFIVITLSYLWLGMERRMHRWVKPAATLAFIWRLVLTTFSGLIFGVIAARDAYDSLFIAPMFIVMSFAFGLALFILVLIASFRLEQRIIDDALLVRLRRMLGFFVIAVLLCIAFFYLAKFSSDQTNGYALFVMQQGGVYTVLFWGAQIGSYGVALALIFVPALRRNRPSLCIACLMIVTAALAHLYLIIIAGQAYPLNIFPGYQVESSFFDGVIANYRPSIWETGLGVGGLSFALLITLTAIRVLPILPEILNHDEQP